MPGSRHRYEFIGKTPTIFAIIGVLFIANIFVSLALTFAGKYLLPKGVPNSHPCPELARWGIQNSVPACVCWYASRSDAITLILGALLALLIFVFRKNIRRVR